MTTAVIERKTKSKSESRNCFPAHVRMALPVEYTRKTADKIHRTEFICKIVFHISVGIA